MKTKPIPQNEPKRREHWSEARPALRDQWQLGFAEGRISATMNQILSQRYRIEADELPTPKLTAMAALPMHLRATFRLHNRPAIQEEERCIAKLRTLEVSGYNGKTRSDEDSASTAKLQADAANRDLAVQGRIDELRARREQEAERAIRARAEAEIARVNEMMNNPRGAA